LQDLVSLNDPVFHEVVQLVQDQQSVGILAPLQGQPQLLEMANQLRKQSELWQRLVAAIKAVDDIAGPVLDRYTKLEKNREKLVGRMEHADEVVPEETSWPPTTVRLTNERTRFRAIESQFISFKRERHKAIQLVALLSELSDNYQDLYNHVGQLLENASQEQSRFKELEHRLNQSRSLWAQRLQDNRSNQVAVSDIERLLASIDKDFNELQRRFKVGALSYQQAYQMFRLICRKIDEATISLGLNQIIDINGMIHRQI
jgi:ubiquinone biosynthesis protein UbiJ